MNRQSTRFSRSLVRATSLVGCALLLHSTGAFAAARVFLATPTPLDLANPAANVPISGKVVDKKGEGLPGVTVLVKGTSIGTSTATDGSFSLQVPEGGTLAFSFVGYARQEVVIAGAKSNLVVTLYDDTQALDDVVVVGYGEEKKETATGAIATVNQKIFQDRGVVDNPLSAIQGQVPGVVVTRSSAAPGRAAWDFQIRGAGTINGATPPLIVVDGIALSDNSALNSINPNDIENISFLKDASAAIYGARAAGGVALITTKKAKAGKFTVQYDGSVSQKRIGLQPQLLNVQQFGQGLVDGLTNDNYGVAPTNYLWYKLGVLMVNPPASGYIDLTNGGTVAPSSNPLNPGFGDVKDIPLFNGNDWVSILWDKAYSTQHNLSFSGRTEKAGFRLSLGYLNDGSLLQWGQNSNARYNVRLTNDFQATERLKIETNLSLEKNDIIQPTLISSVLGQYQQPGFPVSTVDGRAYAWGTQYSPNWQAELGGENKEYNTRVFTNLRLTYDLAKNLKLVGQVGYNWSNADIKIEQKSIQWYNYLATIQAADNPTQANSYYQRRLNKDSYTTLNTYLNYAKTFGEDHSFSATLGANYERDEYNYYLAQTTYLANNSVPSLNLGIGLNTTKTVNEAQNHYAIGSYFSRLNYAYKQRYLLEVNARYDGSSRFIASDRWKAFGGVSAGWRISEENFFKDVSFLNDLKLRSSYGQVGNGTGTGIGLYDYIQLLNVTGTAGATSAAFPIIGSGPAVLVGPTNTLVSLDRTWERIETLDFGLDFGFFSRRLTGSFDYYTKHNRNALINVSYPAVLGANAPFANVGHIKTWGWEFALNWQDKIGPVGYRIGGSLTDNQNRVINGGGNTVIGAGYNAAVEGYSLGSYFGLEYAGRIQTQEQLDAANRALTGANLNQPVATYNTDGTTKAGTGLRLGDNMFKDLNGDGKLTIPGDLKYLGTDAPRYTFAVNLGADWHGFDFSAIIQGVGQRTIFRDGTWRVPFGSIFQGQANFWQGNTWTPTNTEAYYPTLSAGNNGSSATTFNAYNYQISDWSVQNGAYVRLKNLVFGYTLPEPLTTRFGISRLRVYYAGSDLGEITHIKDGWDPEATRNVAGASLQRYPFYRLHSLGVNITL